MNNFIVPWNISKSFISGENYRNIEKDEVNIRGRAKKKRDREKEGRGETWHKKEQGRAEEDKGEKGKEVNDKVEVTGVEE